MGRVNPPADERAREELAAALDRVGGGDADAFQQVYRRTSAKLFGICLRILPRRQDAEEVLQDAYLAVWRRAGSFDRNRGSAMAWLITIVRNRAVDQLRRGGKVISTPIDEASQVRDPAPLAVDRLELDEDQLRMLAALDTLDPRDAGFIRTAFLEGSTYLELAERSGLPLGTVKSRIRRALIKLRTHLE